MRTRTHWLLAILGVGSALAVACERDDELSRVALTLRAPPGCEVGALEGFELRALGDFPARRERFDGRSPTATFDGFPIGTQELAIEARFSGARLASGRVSVPAAVGGEVLPLLLLPESESCPVGDPGLAPGEGAAAAPLPGGGLLIAGGTGSDGRVLSTAVVLRAGRTLLDQVTDGMLLRRRDASATRVADAIVVAGGASDASGEAELTYEVYDVRRGLFARERSRQLSQGPRMQHGAALLPDGSVLLVGGRAVPAGPPLATAQLLRLETPNPEQPAGLHTPRVAPQVLVLDSGAVIVAGGRDQQGGLVTTLERFEAAASRFVTLALTLATFEDAVAVALPGARIAWLGCDARRRAVCGLELVLLRGEEPVSIEVPLAWSDRVPRGLVELRAIALEDGRVLVTGREPDGSLLSRSLVVDLSERTLDSVPATRAPSLLMPVADGTVAELDAFGASLRRLGSASVYDSPEGNLLGATQLRVVVDAPDRWEHSSAGLQALVAAARFELPRLRFGNFRAEFRLEGGVLVWLSAVPAPELSIRIAAHEAAAAGCEALASGAKIVVERRGTAVQVWSEADPRARCGIAWPAQTLAGLAVEADADSLLHELRVTRL